MSSRIGPIAVFTAVMFASALMGVLAKLALVEVPAFTFAWLQILAAGVFLVIYSGFTSVRTGRPILPQLDLREWLAVVAIGLINFGLVRVLMLMALERLPATTYVFLLGFVGLTTMIMSSAFLAERPGRWQILGTLMAIAGVWLFFPVLPAPQEMLGVVYSGLVVIGLATTNNISRWLMTRQGGTLSSSMLSTMAILVGGLPIVVAGLFSDWPPEIGDSRNGWIILANGVIAIALTQTVFNSLLRKLRSYEASVLGGSGLIWTALLAIPILGERLSAIQVGAIVVLLIGLVLAQLRPASPPESGSGGFE